MVYKSCSWFAIDQLVSGHGRAVHQRPKRNRSLHLIGKERERERERGISSELTSIHKNKKQIRLTSLAFLFTLDWVF